MTEYAVDCACRKPKPEIIKPLLEKLRLRTECSITIVDRETDPLAGKAAGIELFLYYSGDFFEFTREAISAKFGPGTTSLVEVKFRKQ